MTAIYRHLIGHLEADAQPLKARHWRRSWVQKRKESWRPIRTQNEEISNMTLTRYWKRRSDGLSMKFLNCLHTDSLTLCEQLDATCCDTSHSSRSPTLTRRIIKAHKIRFKQLTFTNIDDNTAPDWIRVDPYPVVSPWQRT